MDNAAKWKETKNIYTRNHYVLTPTLNSIAHVAYELCSYPVVGTHLEYKEDSCQIVRKVVEH